MVIVYVPDHMILYDTIYSWLMDLPPFARALPFGWPSFPDGRGVSAFLVLGLKSGQRPQVHNMQLYDYTVYGMFVKFCKY